MTEDKFKETKRLYETSISLKARISVCQDKIQRCLLKIKDETISVCDKRDYETNLKLYTERLEKLSKEYKQL